MQVHPDNEVTLDYKAHRASAESLATLDLQVPPVREVSQARQDGTVRQATEVNPARQAHQAHPAHRDREVKPDSKEQRDQ